ncbi:MAG: hypothetical protein LBH44_09390 [Treponema sp.]|jgi:hypothetical protein|nr:hypothetical protein [Treponema sp.]
MWKFRIFLFIGGGLFFILGGLYLASSIIFRQQVESFVFFSPHGAAIILSSFVCFAGFMGVITGLSNNTDVLYFAHRLGFRLAMFSALFFTGAVFCNRAVIAPYFNIIGSWVGASFEVESSIYIISLIVFAVCIQIFHAAINFADYGDIDARVMTFVITRAVFVLGVLPFLFFQPWHDVSIPQMPVGSFATLYGLYVLLFWFIRNGCDFAFISSDLTVLHNIVNTIVCIIAFPVFFLLAGLVYKILGPILEWKSFMPITATAIIMLIVQFKPKWEPETSNIGWFKCRLCDEHIFGRYQYCSDECIEEAKRPVMRQCKTCKKPFMVTKQEQKDGSGAVYCSEACRPKIVYQQVTTYRCGKCGASISSAYSYCSSCQTHNRPY